MTQKIAPVKKYGLDMNSSLYVDEITGKNEGKIGK